MKKPVYIFIGETDPIPKNYSVLGYVRYSSGSLGFPFQQEWFGVRELARNKFSQKSEFRLCRCQFLMCSGCLRIPFSDSCYPGEPLKLTDFQGCSQSKAHQVVVVVGYISSRIPDPCGLLPSTLPHIGTVQRTSVLLLIRAE